MDLDKLEKRARNVLLFQLSRSMKTEEQLRQILIKREIPAEVAEPLLARFVEAQLIDDLQFARSYVTSKLASGGKSAALLRRELSKKGVPAQFIQLALSDLDAEAEFSMALKLVTGRLARMATLDRETKQRRLLGFLMRRGFSSSVSHRALAQALASE